MRVATLSRAATEKDQPIYTVDRFEDNGLAVLETEHGESVVVPRAQIPPEAKEGDVLLELGETVVAGDVRYAVDFELTERRSREAADLRASLPGAPVGDIEL